jgi:hypothetical protein
MRINQVPSCCGAAVIHDLGFNGTYDEALIDYKKFEDTITRYLNKSFSQFTIILNDRQKERLHRRLVEFGFKRVSQVRGKSSQNLHTYLYLRPVKEPFIATLDTPQRQKESDLKVKVNDKIQLFRRELIALEKEINTSR